MHTLLPPTGKGPARLMRAALRLTALLGLAATSGISLPDFGGLVGTGTVLAATCPPAAAAPGPYTVAVLADSPRGFWRLGDAPGSGCAADASGHGLTGQVLGGVVPGRPGATYDGETAMAFDGSSGYISLGDPAGLQPAQLSVEAWVDVAAPPAATAVIVRKRGYGYALSLDTTGHPLFATVDQSAATYTVVGPPVADGQWHHLVGTYNGSRVCLYVDGISAGACVAAPAIHYGPDLVAIGRDGGYSGSYFAGSIDDVAIYGAALSPARVQAHYIAGHLVPTAIGLTGDASCLTVRCNPALTAVVQPLQAGHGSPSGTVTFLDGAAVLGTEDLVNGQATFNFGTLALGKHSFTAIYGGDGTFGAAVSAALAQTLTKAGTQVNLQVPAKVTYGQAASLVVQIGYGAPPHPPVGIVSFKDGTKVLGAVLSYGEATFAAAGLVPGTHAITATFGGNAAFTAGTSTPQTVVVVQAPTSVAVISDAEPQWRGQPVTLSAVLGGAQPGANAPTGTVTFMDGSVVLGTAPVAGMTAALTISALGTGAHTITAAYSGDANYAGAASTSITEDIV